MQQTAAVVFLALAATATGAVDIRGRGSGRGATGLQPDVAAESFSRVEDSWHAEVMAMFQGNATDTNESAIPESFDRSCALIVNAAVEGSSGDKANVREYLGRVCGEGVLAGWKAEECQNLAAAVDGAMGEDSAANREGIKVQELCAGFWANFRVKDARRSQEEIAEAKKRAEEEAAAEAAREKAAEEAAARRRAEREAEEQREAEEAAATAAAAAANQTTTENATAANATSVENATAATDAPEAAAPAVNATESVAANATAATENATTVAQAPANTTSAFLF